MSIRRELWSMLRGRFSKDVVPVNILLRKI